MSPLLLAAGCASPGRPLPPSLTIPRPETDLAAARVGDEVRLFWTTPARTVDGVAVKGPIVAEICRAREASTPPTSGAVRVAAATPGCAVTAKISVAPGASEATDLLRADDASGVPGVLVYRIQLRGGKKARTAGPGAAAYVLSGTAPPPVEGLTASDTGAGAVLAWTPDAGAAGSTVELTRTIAGGPTKRAPAAAPAAPPASVHRSPFHSKPAVGRATTDRASADVRLSAGPGDPGGVLDRTAALGTTYRYAAERVLTVTLGGRTLAMRSAVSAPVSLAIDRIFPPAAPLDLVGAPGPGSIDLSWQPGAEPGGSSVSAARGDMGAAGFRVYRQAATGNDEWQRLTSDLVGAPGFRDRTVQPGHTYRYRITAVDSLGLESGPSAEISVSAEP